MVLLNLTSGTIEYSCTNEYSGTVEYRGIIEHSDTIEYSGCNKLIPVCTVAIITGFARAMESHGNEILFFRPGKPGKTGILWEGHGSHGKSLES